MAEDGSQPVLRKVLIALDGSEHSDRAFEWCMKSIIRPGDKVLLFHAFEIPPLPYSSGPFVFAYYEEWSETVKQSREGCEVILRSYEEKLKKTELFKTKQIQHQIVLVVGKPAGEVLCHVTKEDGVDLVVLGSRGQGVIRRTFLGSVSDYAVHNANIPVCVCPKPAEKSE